MKEKKTTDAAVKKRNLYFIIIAVCVLLLAAVTVFTVLIATDRPGTSIDNPGGNGGEEPGPGPDEPTDTEIVFSMPVANATVKTTYSFWYNSTLNKYCLHTGIDFAAEAGTKVCAAYGGKDREHHGRSSGRRQDRDRPRRRVEDRLFVHRRQLFHESGRERQRGRSDRHRFGNDGRNG